MRLGNSFGNNKGKRYLRKEEIDQVYAIKAEDFNKWMSQNYSSLVCFLKDRNIFDEDVFNETYEKIYEKILYSDIKGGDYRAYFQRAYYTNVINSKVQNNRFTELLPIHERDNVDTEYFAEIEQKQIKLENDIMDYIYSNYEIRDYEIFKMYVNLKPAINYETLAEITGVKSHNIAYIISKIKKDICNNKDFAKRRKEIL